MAVDWFPDWSNQACAIVASGQSATQDDLDRLKGRCRIAVVNNSFRLAPWADMLYAADGGWWGANPDARLFAGLKVTANRDVAKRFGLHLVRVRDETDSQAHAFSLDEQGLIGHGGNGGFQVFNLVVQFGARRILLVGFDMGGEHWHDKHEEPLKNPRPQTLAKWRERLDAQAARLAGLGVDVVNVSPMSALTAYRKMPIRDATIHFGLG